MIGTCGLVFVGKANFRGVLESLEQYLQCCRVLALQAVSWQGV